MRKIGKGSIRYLRWTSQILFFGLFVFLVGQLVCSVFLPGGLRISCPLGVLNLTVASGILFLEVVVAGLLFLVIAFLFGRAFCGWACPVGTLIDAADAGISRFHPVKIERSNGLVRNVVNKYAVLAASLFGAFIFRYPIFCIFCPIGIVCRGSLAGLEMFMIPVAATGLSFWGERFFCRYLCPVGAIIDGVSALSPFFKIGVDEKKCVFKEGCADECEDFHMDLCAVCRLADDKKCERECKSDIDLVDKGSLARCTRCLDCYVACDYDAIRIALLDKSAFRPIVRFYNYIRVRLHTREPRRSS